MKSRFQQIGALLLLTILSVSLIPVESFHHHEEELVVCQEASNHVESKRFECGFSDYTASEFLNHQIYSKSAITSFEFLFQTKQVDDVSLTNYSLQRYRGPPTFG